MWILRPIIFFINVIESQNDKEESNHCHRVLLLGLPLKPEQQNLFCALFLAMYVTTVLGNHLIFILIQLDSHLHTPMCLFLSNWSFSDLCFYFITMPTSLQNMQSQVPSIP